MSDGVGVWAGVFPSTYNLFSPLGRGVGELRPYAESGWGGLYNIIFLDRSGSSLLETRVHTPQTTQLHTRSRL